MSNQYTLPPIVVIGTVPKNMIDLLQQFNYVTDEDYKNYLENALSIYVCFVNATVPDFRKTEQYTRIEIRKPNNVIIVLINSSEVGILSQHDMITRRTELISEEFNGINVVNCMLLNDNAKEQCIDQIKIHIENIQNKYVKNVLVPRELELLDKDINIMEELLATMIANNKVLFDRCKDRLLNLLHSKKEDDPFATPRLRSSYRKHIIHVFQSLWYARTYNHNENGENWISLTLWVPGRHPDYDSNDILVYDVIGDCVEKSRKNGIVSNDNLKEELLIRSELFGKAILELYENSFLALPTKITNDERFLEIVKMKIPNLVNNIYITLETLIPKILCDMSILNEIEYVYKYWVNSLEFDPEIIPDETIEKAKSKLDKLCKCKQEIKLQLSTNW